MAAVAQPANTKYIHNGSSNGNGDSPSTPWSYAHFRTLAAGGTLATNTAYKFLAGRYEGQLTISGVVATQSAPVVLEPHDGGEAVFTGSRDVNTGWTWDNTVNCWKTTDLPSGLTHIHNLYDGANGPYELKQLAQRNNNGFYQPQALFPGSGTLVDPALPLASSDDLTGARILYRYANWGYAYAVVTDHDVNASNQPRLHFPTVVSSDTWNGTWGYNLLDRLDFLDAPGEWFHDRTAQPNVLYYNNGSSSTSPTAIRVSSNIQNWGVLMNKLQPGSTANEWITIRGLRFEHFDDELYPPILDSQYIIDSYRNNSANYPRGTGIRIDRGLHKNITIEHCVFSDLRFGIENFMPAEYSRDMSYLDNTFQRVYSNAIRCGIYDARIERNNFLDIGRVPGQAFSDFGFNVALIVASDGFEVRHNRFIGMGGSGIAVGPVAQVNGGPEANLVEHNYLNPGLLTLNDHGAITFDKCESVLIRENIVVDMEGNSETSAGGDFQKDRTVGIYTGYVAPVKNVNLVRNIVTGVGTGINVDHAPEHANNNYLDNTVFACRGAQLNLFDGGIPSGNQYEPAFSSNFHGNILYCTKAEQHPVDILQVKALAWQGGSRPRVDFGSFNGNFYFNPFSDITHYMGFFRDDFVGVGNYMGSLAQPRDVPFTLQSWRALVEPNDVSTRSPLRLKDYAVLGNPAVVATHSTECTPADATWSNSAALTGDGSMDGHYKRFVDLNFCERWAGSGSPGVTAVTTGSPTPPGELYRITFRARSNTTNAIRLAPLVNINSLAIDPSTYVSLTQDWSQQEALIDLTGPNSADRFAISFQNAQRGMGALTGSTTVDIDHVRTDIVTLDPDYYASEVEPNHILRFNCPLPGTEHVMNAGASFTVPGDPGQCWSDVHGNFYAAGDEIILDEWASIVLFRMDVPDANLALNGNGEHHIVENTLWTDNMNVEGSVVVNDGFTLTIDGAHIGFAASTQSLTTNITVQPGGTLTLRNGATLRNWMGCGNNPTMWDGVKASGGATGPQPTVRVLSGARIMDAHTALLFIDTDPQDPVHPLTFNQPATLATGSRPTVELRDAILQNNRYDVVLAPAGLTSLGVPLNFVAERTCFATTSALRNPDASPIVHVYLHNARYPEFKGCSFVNSSGLYENQPHRWGTGIWFSQSAPRVYDSNGLGCTFERLKQGIYGLHGIKGYARVDRSAFTKCAAGITLVGVHHARITRNTFDVPDMDVRFRGVPGVYGTYFWGSSGFELEDNTYTGAIGSTYPKVGAIFYNTGGIANEYYRNTFDRFHDNGNQSAGTIIMGGNGPEPDYPQGGLTFKCNNYSSLLTDDPNDHDIAFTKLGTSICPAQGANQDTYTLAGNTFANYGNGCGGNNERHLFVNAEASTTLNSFLYWHHVDVSAKEFRPHCDSDPIVTTGAGSWIQEGDDEYDEEDESLCASDLSGRVSFGEALATVAAVNAEYELLAEVYGNWRDGGDTEGLKEFIMDPANDSYAVRNQLMLVAPSVTHDNWEQAILVRQPPLNPWHLAQALVANSPLQPETVRLVDSTLVNPYYLQLVLDAQDSISMHSIYQSELNALHGKASRAAHDALAMALIADDSAQLDSALQVIGSSNMAGQARLLLSLYLAQDDLLTAGNLIDSMRTHADNDYWAIQQMALDLLSEGKSMLELTDDNAQLLREMVQGEGPGSPEAAGWLLMLGDSIAEPLVLPDHTKRGRSRTPQRAAQRWVPLTVFPNPANGPVSVAYEVPEGVALAELRVMNALGQLVHRQALAGKGIVELARKGTAPGLHVVGLFYDGQLVATEKLQWMR